MTWRTNLFAVLAVSTVMAGPQAAESRQPAPTITTEQAIEVWGQEDENCRGGSGDDPATQRACDRRESVSEILASRGWCYGKRGEAGYLAEWHRCGRNSVRH